MSNQPAVGIDVGFRQCCIAFVNDKNEAQVIQTDGKAKTPAYVSYSFKSPNTFINLVGTNAVNAMLRGQHAIHSPKRILGQHFSHPQVQTFIQKVPFPIINDNGTPTMAMHYSYWKNENKLFHPEEVLAKILRYQKDHADKFLKTHTKKVVLTVPATFSYQQRVAAEDSALMAGFSTVEIITEATAAVIAYSHKEKILDGMILVFDLGMATFDLTLLEVKGKQISILAAGGDPLIGGQIFTENILDYVTQRYREKYGGEEYNANYIDELRDICELKKKDLFNSNCENVQIGYAGYYRGNSTITENIFESSNSKVLTKIETTLKNFLSESVSDVKGVGQVILVGGSTRIPRIEKIVRLLLQNAEIKNTIDVETVVALGAAIQANSKPPFTEHPDASTLSSLEPPLVPVIANGVSTPVAIGIHFTYDWQIQQNNQTNFGIVIPKGKEIPCFAEKNFWFPQDNGEAVIRIFQGDSNDAEKNDEVGPLVLDGIARNKQHCQLKIQMYLSANGELKVRATNMGWLKYDWKFTTLDIFQTRRSSHFLVHRSDPEYLNTFGSQLKTNPVLADQHTRESMTDLAKVYYQEKMDPLVSSLEFVSEKTFNEIHEKALEEAILELRKAFPLTSELIESTLSDLVSLFRKYSQMNNRKKNKHSRNAIGIDLGTSYSYQAFVGQNGMEFISNQVNALNTPTCVNIDDDGEITFGFTAQSKGINIPENFIFDIKRMLGRHIQNPQISQLKRFWPFRIADVQGSIYINLHGKKYRPEELMALYVKHLIRNASEFLNEDVINAVVTIPTYFTPTQRHLTKEAFHDAGINVLRLLNEPTAAALAYIDGIPEGTNKTCLLFDLGGGTFDLAILEVTGPTQVKIKAIDGDPFLGGSDFDTDLVKYCIQEFEKKYKVRLQDKANYATNLLRLKKQCEKVKKNLTITNIETVSLDAVYENLNLVVRVDRGTFEKLIEDKLMKCMAIVNRIVEDVKIDEVVLVGGSSRIPRVKTLLKQKFGDIISSERFSTNEVVVRGAALLAARIQNNDTSFCIEELDKKIII